MSLGEVSEPTIPWNGSCERSDGVRAWLARSRMVIPRRCWSPLGCDTPSTPAGAEDVHEHGATARGTRGRRVKNPLKECAKESGHYRLECARCLTSKDAALSPGAQIRAIGFTNGLSRASRTMSLPIARSNRIRASCSSSEESRKRCGYITGMLHDATDQQHPRS